MTLKKFMERVQNFAQKPGRLVVVAAAVVLLVLAQAWFSWFYKDRVLDSYSYYYAAQAMNRGANPYDSQLLIQLGQADGIESVYPYLYPPVLAIAFRPLALFGPLAAHRVLLISDALLLIIILILLYKIVRPQRHPQAIFFLFLLFLGVNHALSGTFRLGQINPAVTLAVILSLYFHLQKKDWFSSLFLALAILLKMTPAILLLYFVLFYPRRWAYLAKLAVWMVVLVAGSCLFTPPENWLNFIASAQQGPPFRTFDSFWGALTLATHVFPGLSVVKTPLFLLIAISFLVLSVLSIRRLSDTERPYYAFALLMLLSLFLSPLTWSHHYTFCLLTFLYIPAFFWDRNAKKQFLLFWTLSLICLFNLPKPIFRPIGGQALILIGLLRTAAGFGVLWLTIRAVYTERKPRKNLI